MKFRTENEETKKLFEFAKLTDEEIFKQGSFRNLEPAQILELKETVFNFSLLLLKLDAYGPT